MVELKGDWMQTYTSKFYPLSPREEDIYLIDIAQSLSHTCRFGGHVKNFYSVGQHSVLLSYFCGFEGLMHDAAETYINDITRPVKYIKEFQPIREVEDSILKVIFSKYNISYPLSDKLKKLDRRICITEANKLMIGGTKDWYELYEPLDIVIDPWGFEESRFKFIRRFWELYNVNY